MSGLMSLTGRPDDSPTMAGTFVVDYSTAMFGATAVLAALHKRDRTGEGECIDLTLLDSAVSILLTSMQRELVLGRKATRVGNRDRQVAPGNIFRARDNVWLMLIAGSDVHFNRLADVMGMPQLLEDERFCDADTRLAHADDIEGVVQEWFGRRDAAEILNMMEKVGIVCSRVEDVSDMVKNPQLHFRKKIIAVPHGKLGDIPMVEMPMSFGNSPFILRRAAPMLGEHSGEVLREWLGMSPEAIERHRQKGVL
jgi:CoA:oxalate CoA-transferase